MFSYQMITQLQRETMCDFNRNTVSETLLCLDVLMSKQTDLRCFWFSAFLYSVGQSAFYVPLVHSALTSDAASPTRLPLDSPDRSLHSHTNLFFILSLTFLHIEQLVSPRDCVSAFHSFFLLPVLIWIFVLYSQKCLLCIFI